MYFISNLCHLCLNDKFLIDLAEKTPLNETIRTKLNVCISEVKWSASKKIFICNLCVQKLEMVYDFKQTCIKSVSVLENHLNTFRENTSKLSKAQLHVVLSNKGISQNMINKYIKSQINVKRHGMLAKALDQTLCSPPTGFIITNGNGQVSYQNIFLNFVSTPQTNMSHMLMNMGNQKGTDNIPSLSGNDISLKQLLETKNPEEVSIEIDPSLYNFEHFLVPKPKSARSVANIECNECLQSFATIKLLRVHIDVAHNGNLPFSCTYCFSKFLLRDHYDKHVKYHIDNGVDSLVGSTVNLDNISKISHSRISGNNIQIEFKCSFCSQVCDSTANLETHEYTIHNVEKPKSHYVKGQKSATCDICFSEFSTESYLEQHMKLHFSKKSRLSKKPSKKEHFSESKLKESCELKQDNEIVEIIDLDTIDEKTNNQDNEVNSKPLNENVQNNNLEANNETIDNGNPVIVSPNDALLNKFIIECEDGKPFCSLCKKKFGRKHDLKRHINNLHIKCIEYICHLCDEKFNEGFHLTRHLRNHYSSLSCSVCHHMFAGISEVTNHMLAVHKQLTNVDCNVCYISFDNMETLKNHIEEHLLEIVYKCHLCEKTFAECRDLTKHVSEHSAIKTCENCNHPCYTEEDYVEHKKACVVEEMYKCEICPKAFKKKKYLQVHTRAKHTVEISIDEPQKKRIKVDNI